MQKKYLVRIALAVVLMAGSFIILSSSIPAGKKQTCSESMEECSKQKENNTPSGEMIWESLSRQFISSIEITR